MTNRNVSIGARNKNSETYFAIMRNWFFSAGNCGTVYFVQWIIVNFHLLSSCGFQLSVFCMLTNYSLRITKRKRTLFKKNILIKRQLLLIISDLNIIIEHLSKTKNSYWIDVKM